MSAGAKTCTKCGERKALSQYHRDRSSPDGRQYWCKGCRSAASREYRQQPQVRERYREYMHEYDQRPERKERARQRARTDLQRPEVRARRRKAARRWRAANPEQGQASHAVRTAVARHELPEVRDRLCADCRGRSAQEYHHHRGYAPAHRLDVVALCEACHTARHNGQVRQ